MQCVSVEKPNLHHVCLVINFKLSAIPIELSVLHFTFINIVELIHFCVSEINGFSCVFCEILESYNSREPIHVWFNAI